jgi:geranylgeranyl pyrophosphate synthase
LADRPHRPEILERVYEPVRERLDKVGEDLRALSRNQPPFLAELLGHVLETTGKRIRPALALLTSNFHPNDGRKAEIMATAVELLHIASLIHDDTVDNSEVRRGRDTVSSRWGRDTAVLLGDYVFATSTTFVCDTGNIRVIRRFSETAVELSSGELEEVAAANNWTETREEYLERIYRKTASLFSSVGEAGAVLSGAPEDMVQSLKWYSRNLGMAFQIVDDILDIEGTSEEVGKPVGSDLARGIMTLPAIIAVERHPENNPFLSLFQEDKDEESQRRAVDLIQDSSIIRESYAVAEEYGRRALDRLKGLTHSPSRDSLEELVPYVVGRRS